MSWLSPRLEGLILTIAAPALAGLLVYGDWLWRLDHVLYDWSLRTSIPAADENVVIIAIDQRSLTEIGGWPWSRRVHAALLDRLTDAGAAVVALDLIMAEPNVADPDGDQRLVEALRRNRHVILPVAFDQPIPGGQVVEVLPLPDLAQAAAGLGQVDVVPDQDGIVRSIFLKAGLGSPRWSNLPLAVLEHVEPEAGQELPGERADVQAPSPYAWIRDHRILIAFVGPSAYRQLSYVDVLEGRFPDEILRDRFVLVGATANGLGSNLATPLTGSGAPMSGVAFNANVLDALRHGLVIRELSTGWIALLSAGAALVPLLLYPLLSSRWTLPVACGALVLTLLASLLALQLLGVWYRPAAAVLAIALSYPFWSWIQLRHALRYQRSLTEAQERALVTLHSVGDGVITTDPQGVVQDLNPTAEKLTGYTVGEARGQPIETVVRVVNEHSRLPNPLPLPELLQTGTITRLPEPTILIDRGGQEALIRTSAAPIHDAEGATLGMVLAIADITEARRLADRMAYQATHDLLTGLPNRVLLEDRLQHAIAHARRTNQTLGVLFIDLDRFKTVNDGLGHSAGDALLKAVGTRLKIGLREADTIARLGGDEFVVVLESLTDAAAIRAVAEKLLAQFETAFVVEQHELLVTCSVGIALFPRDGEDVAMLLKNADSAMYRAKQLGRANAQFYAPGMDSRARDQLLLSQRLRRAIDRDELELYYQPQVDVTRGRVTAVEALVRWHHPERGLLEPDAFVPLAEATNLIMALDNWVIREAYAQLRAWRQAGLPDIRVAVNLSPRQLARPDIGRVIAETVEASDLDPCCFELEITERTIMQDLDRTIENLRVLKSIGVMLAIDDFGTGYSSLSYLTALPVDRLKIDRSFIRAIPDDAQNTAIAGAIIAMAQSLGLSVVAEGVETSAQVDFLRAKGCGEAQGNLICQPMPASALTTLLRASSTLLPGA